MYPAHMRMQLTVAGALVLLGLPVQTAPPGELPVAQARYQTIGGVEQWTLSAFAPMTHAAAFVTELQGNCRRIPR
jgi:hypothetical protein